jgi:hypothetical protein
MTKDGGIDAVRRRLNSAWHTRALTGNLSNLRSRVASDGYFQESLTGVYQGMFPRTVGALARLLTLIGEIEPLQLCVDYVLGVMEEEGLDRVPHVITPRPGARPLCDMIDQVDGQAHVILAWALLSLARGQPGAGEERWWPLVSGLMDRSVDSPYLSRNTRWRIHPGLVLNLNMEHSRDWEFWFAYDLLTQSFVAAALEAMIRVAERRGDGASARWRDALAFLEAGIAREMVHELDGVRVYREMLLPTGRKPVPFDGLGWMTITPIPSGWQGADPEILANTARAWHARATVSWSGPSIAACDWTPAGHTNQIYGKQVGWDLVACMQMADYGLVCDRLDFLESENKSDLYAEIFDYHPDSGQWTTRDPGNGEQVAWLCWSIARVRQMAGLPLIL